MKHARTLFAPVLAAALLAACSSPPAALDEAAARRAVLEGIDAAFAVSAEADGRDLASASALTSQALEPTVVIRRSDMRRSRDLQRFELDLSVNPPTASAEVALTITGTAELWQVYPDRSAGRTLVGEKPIALAGSATFTAHKLDGRWTLDSVERSALSQGEGAAVIDEVAFEPDPLVPGSSDNLAWVSLSAPDPDDDFLVVARGGHLRPRGVLHDDGAAPDAEAGDGIYSGTVEVGADARRGEHLAFVSALDYSRTADLTTGDDGSYLHPYTDTLLPVMVTVGDVE